jgi:hypothetical protein
MTRIKNWFGIDAILTSLGTKILGILRSGRDFWDLGFAIFSRHHFLVF